MEEKTVKELQQELVELGMPAEDADKFTTKAPLIATINTLKASKAVGIEKVNPKEEKAIEKGWETKRATMARLLDAQPKVSFMFQLEANEKPGVVRVVERKGIKEYIHVSGAVETSTLNGYLTIWPKGVMITDMPQQVAQNFAEAMNMTVSAGKEILADRIDPQTGNPVSDQL